MKTLQFPMLAEVAGLRHVITTRHGGVGTGDYADFNLAYHVGDDADVVSENRQRLMREVGLPLDGLISARQVHDCRIHDAAAVDAGRGALDWASALPGTDGMVIAETNLAGLILVADCAPVLIADRRRQVLAVVHAGWRGALAGITGQAVAAMVQAHGCRTADMMAGIGPCLCAPCFEVGDEVVAEVHRLYPAAVVEGDAKSQLDLRAMIASDLTAHGVASGAIEMLSQCPRCDVSTFFSHRGEHGKTGRFGLLAWWE